MPLGHSLLGGGVVCFGYLGAKRTALESIRGFQGIVAAAGSRLTGRRRQKEWMGALSCLACLFSSIFIFLRPGGFFDSDFGLCVLALRVDSGMSHFPRPWVRPPYSLITFMPRQKKGGRFRHDFLCERVLLAPRIDKKQAQGREEKARCPMLWAALGAVSRP